MKYFSKYNSTLLFLSLTGLLVVVAFISYNKVLQYNRSVESLMHINQVQSKIEDVLSNLKDAEIEQRGFLLTADSSFLESFAIEEQESMDAFAALDTLVEDANQQLNLIQLKKLVNERFDILDVNLLLLQDKYHQALPDFALIRGKDKMIEVRAQVAMMLEVENKLKIQRTDHKDRTASITPLSLLLLSLISILIIYLFYFRLRKETNQRITVTERNLLLREANQQIEKSEKFLSNILSQSLIGISILKGPQMVITFANETMLKILGKGESILHHPLLEGVPELDNQIFPELLQKVYQSGVPEEGLANKMTLVRDGIPIVAYFNFIFQPYRETDGTITGVTLFTNEVTDQVLAKRQIDESEKRFNTLSETIPHMMWTATPEGNKDFFNKYFLDYTGTSLKDLMDGGWKNLIFSDDLERDLILWQQCIESGEEFKIEKRIRHHNGEYRWHLSHAGAQRDSEGEIIRWIGTSTEIDDQKKITEVLSLAEEQFRTFANNIQNLAWIATRDGWLYWYNQRWFDYTGTTLEEMKGSGWAKVHHPDHLKRVEAFVAESWFKNEPFELTFPLRRHDGEYRWFLTRAFPVKDIAGKVDRWIGTNTDITEQKSFAEDLEQKVSERTAELLMQNQNFEIAEKVAKLGSYKWNITTGAMEYSDNFFRLLDCEPREFVPSFKKFLSFIHPDDVQQVLNDQRQTVESDTLFETPYRIVSKKGIIKHFRSNGRFYGEGSGRFLVGTVQDISNDVVASSELNRKNLELENANAELASFNYVASHDLQEPLRKIQAFSKRILKEEEDGLSETAQDYFNRINAAAARMQKLITSILNYSSTNKKDLAFEKTDLNQILNEVMTTLHETIQSKNAVIESQPLPTLQTVPVLMHQLFLNLLNNSLKYAKKDVIPVIKITVEKVSHSTVSNQTPEQTSFWKIAVSDNGIGFDQQYENKIFEVFQRLHGKNEYEGTGIGLAICKKIVLAHHGTISATGKPGVGAMFTFFLPDDEEA